MNCRFYINNRAGCYMLFLNLNWHHATLSGEITVEWNLSTWTTISCVTFLDCAPAVTLPIFFFNTSKSKYNNESLLETQKHPFLTPMCYPSFVIGVCVCVDNGMPVEELTENGCWGNTQLNQPKFLCHKTHRCCVNWIASVIKTCKIAPSLGFSCEKTEVSPANQAFYKVYDTDTYYDHVWYYIWNTNEGFNSCH